MAPLPLTSMTLLSVSGLTASADHQPNWSVSVGRIISDVTAPGGSTRISSVEPPVPSRCVIATK
jgi:hypothetical protein